MSDRRFRNVRQWLQEGRERRNDARASDPIITVFHTLSSHPYVSRVAELTLFESKEFRVAGATTGIGEFIRAKPSVLHLQWIDVYLRKKSYSASLLSVVRVVSAYTILRCSGVGIVWTCHNAVGKGHSRVRLDRAARGAFVVLAKSIIVLNAEVSAQVVADTPLLLKRSAKRKIRHVPMPNLPTAHGAPKSRDVARRELGIESTKPVLAYFPGANQRVVPPTELASPAFALITNGGWWSSGEVRPTQWGWAIGGRADDALFGLAVAASDAVLLCDESAFGSMTLHAAVDLERAVIGPRCPATLELERLGGARCFDGPATAERIADAVSWLQHGVDPLVWQRFKESRSDADVGSALQAIYRLAAGRGTSQLPA